MTSRLKVLLVILGALVVSLLALVLVARGYSVAERSAGGAEVGRLVDSYLQARADGRAEDACALLTEDGQRDLARLVARIPVGQASPDQCPRYVLETSAATVYTSPGIDQLASEDRAFKHWVGGGILVTGPGGAEPHLPARLERGVWKLDGLMPWRGTFVARCEEEGQRPDYCDCLFHELRIRGYGSMDDTTALLRRRAAGEMPAPLLESARACV
jgi:hypothetical protein